MADQTVPPSGNGRRFAPSFRNELSLGNILVIVGLIAGGVGFALRYENRITLQESSAVYFQRELERLERQIDISRDVAVIRRGVGDLLDQHRKGNR